MAAVKKNTGTALGLFRALLAATNGALENFSTEAVQNLVRERALLLTQLDAERDMRRETGAIHPGKDAPEFARIREQIVDLDSALVSRLTTSVSSTRLQLALLTDASRAARAYVRNTG